MYVVIDEMPLDKMPFYKMLICPDFSLLENFGVMGNLKTRACTIKHYGFIIYGK